MIRTRLFQGAATVAAVFALAGAAPMTAHASQADKAPSVTAQAETGASAQAAKCWKETNSKWWCHNVKGLKVYETPRSTSKVVGYINTNPSWFYCKWDSGENHGGTHPKRWLNTMADNGKKGWVNDNDVVDETNPLRVCGDG